jgi:hypothetical protein
MLLLLLLLMLMLRTVPSYSLQLLVPATAPVHKL